MNKIFKVVWSKTKECYVVVSEVAKNNGGKKKVLASVLAGLAMAGVGAFGNPALASYDDSGSKINIAPNAKTGNYVGNNSVVVGYENRTDADNNNWGRIIYGANNIAAGASTLALGNENEARGDATTAIGVGSKALDKQSVALGNVARATKQGSVAIGSYVNAETKNSGTTTAPVYNSKDVGQYSTAVGSQSWTKGDYSAAYGYQAEATGTNAVAIGRVSKATDTSATAVGVNNKAQAQDSSAVGSSNTIAAGATQASAFGRENTVNRGGTIAAGYKNTTDGDRNVAIGNENTTTGEETIGIGTKVIAGTGKTIAIGSVYNPGGGVEKQTIARGDDTINPATGQVNNIFALAIGNGAQADGKDNKASGMIAIGQDVVANNNNTIAMGVQAKATGNQAIAFGKIANASGSGAFALGQATNATSHGSIALGNGAQSTGSGSTALGRTAKAANDGTVAVGFSAEATGDGAIAIGGDGKGAAFDNTNTTFAGLGEKTTASAKNAVAVGHQATANIEGGVALGSESKTTKDAGEIGYNPAKDRTNDYKALTNNTKAALTSTRAAVSIGDDSASVTRQLTGLAAGTQDTDAVNVAQLKAVNLKYAGDTGNSDVLLKDGTLNINGDTDTFISTSADANGVKITAKVGENITTNADGKAVAPTTNGIATTDNVTQAINNSGWKVTSSNNGGTTNGSSSEKVSPGDKVTFSAGKNIVLDQAGKQFTYSLNKDVDLTKAGSLTIGDTKITNDGVSITGGPSITKTGIDAGSKKITNVEKGTADTDAVNVKQLKDTEKHIKPGTYAVANDGSVTLKYVDGNGTEQTETAKITGIAKKSKVINGQNTTVEEGTDTADNSITYKVNVKGDLADISSITNGAGSGKVSFAGNQVVKVEGDNPISLDGKGGYVTGLQNKDWDITNPTIVSGRAATEDQLKKVSDGFNNTVKLAGNTGNTDTQKLSQAGGLSFGVVGANNGQYIKTTASGTDVVADLSDDAKTKLNKTYTVSSGSTNVTVTPTTVGDNTDFKISVTNPSTPGGASSTESVVKKAAATGDTNLADIAVENGKNSGDPDAKYSVNVSRNAVKDAAREAVTVNNGGTTTGGNYTADADNPITVNPVKDDANHNTTYEVKFDGEKAAKQIPLTYKANGTGDQTVKLDKGLNFTNGSNTTASVAADGVVKYDLNKDVDLTKNGSLTIGDTKVNNDGVTITGGPSVKKDGINAGNQKITNVKPATDGTDAVNYDQLKAARTVVTSNDKSVTINKTTNGDQVTYDLHVNAAAGTASTWNLKSGAVSATEGTHSGDTDQNIADGKSVTMQAGKNLTVTQTNDGAGSTEVAYALDKDLKDLDSVTTKEVKLGDKNDNISIKKDGDRITYSTDGGTTVKKVANLKDEKHITATTAGNEYTVDNDGNVTMTYTDGNGDLVTGEKAVIKGVAKNDLSNINNDGKKVITGLGSVVKAGDNVVVKTETDATTGQKTYTVNSVSPVVYTTPAGDKLTKKDDGKFYKADGSEYTGGDIIASFENPNGTPSTTDGTMIVNNIGSAIKNQTGADYLTKLDTANGLTPNAAVNVSDLHNTAEALRSSELHIAPTTVKAGSTEAKGGTANAAGTENVYKYDATNKTVTLTYNDGKGTAVTDTKAVIDFSDLNIPAAGNNYGFKANATADGGKVANDTTTPAVATAVENGGTVNFAAGKNLTVKQTVDAANKTQTYTYSLDKDLTNLDKVVVNGKDGQAGKDGVTIVGPQGATGAPGIPGTNGIDGKVGISGKDGKDAVSISGKDGVGHIGLTGPAGKDGKNVTADITVKEGKAGVDGKDGVDGITRIFYNDKDGNEHQVATHDDGMKFAGDDGQANQDTNAQVIKKHLNNVVDIIGGADKTKLTSTDNIGVNNVGGKLKVQLAKNVDLDADGSLTTGATKVDNKGVTITAPAGGTTTDVKLTKDGLDNGGNKIVNVKAGENDTDAVNVKQLKDKVTTVESSDSSIKVVDKNVAGQPGYDAAKGHQYDITINNQTVVEKAQTPVVYTNKDGDKLYKIVDPATGNVTFNTKPDGTGTTVQPADVIASMNNGGDSTTTPMKLNNVGSTIADQAGNTYLDKIDAAAADNKTKNGAVNVTDLKNTADALIEKGLKFDANSGGVKTNKLGSTVKIQGEGTKADTEYSGENVKTIIGQDADGNTTIDVKLDKNLKADSVVVGKDGKDGVDGKIGVNGKDGASVVLNGKDGSIGLTGPKGADGKDGASAKISVKDGVPGVDGQPGDKLTRIVYQDKDGNEHEVATHDDGMKFAGDDGQTDATKVIKKHLNNVVDIVGGADKAKLTDNNIGVNNDNGKLKVQLSKDLDLTNDGSVKIGDTKVNNDGLTINGGPSVKKDGINAGDKKITGVKAGEADTDAVNVKQLKDKVTTVESSDNTISVTDKNDPTSATYDAAKGHQYDIKINNQGVVNNAQIPVVYTKQDGTKVYKQPDGTFNTAKDGSGTVVAPNEVIASMNSAGDSTTAPTKLNNVGSSIADKAGNTFLDKIDAAAGDNNTKNGAVNVSDLKNAADAIGNKGLNFGTQSTGTNSEIHKNLGEKLEIVGEGTKADDNYSASNIKTMTKDGKVVIGLDKDLNGLNSIGVPGKDGVAGKDGVSISGKDGANGIDGKVSIGKDGKDAVSIAGKDGVGHIGLTGPQGPAGADGTGVDISTDHGSKTLVKPEANNGDKSERIVYVPKDKDGNPLKDTDGNPIKREVATMDDGLKFTGNNTGTENKHALNTLVKVQGEGVTAAQSTAFQSAAGNINVVADGNDTLTVKLNKDLKGINSIKNSDNGPALNFNAGDLSVTGGNLNMGGNKITNLGKGTNDTDAVNLKQLKDSRTIVKSTDGSVGVRESESADGAKVYDLSTGASPRFDELTDEIGRVGAQGAALAALKPIQYDPLEPTQIMAGYGNYRGNSAIAMGVAHYKNESTLMHAGVSWAGGSRHMMANAGVTWKVGNRDSEAAVADRYRKGPISSAYAMQQEMASVKAQNAGLKTEVSDLKAENEQMKAQIAAMMAKLGM